MIESRALIQQRCLRALGFRHQETTVDSQAHYTGHGLSFTLPAEETDPEQIMIHILQSSKASFQKSAREALIRVVGPLAKI